MPNNDTPSDFVTQTEVATRLDCEWSEARAALERANIKIIRITERIWRAPRKPVEALLTQNGEQS